MYVRVSILTFIFEDNSVHLMSDICVCQISRTWLFSQQTGVTGVLCSEDMDITVWVGFGKLNSVEIKEYIVIENHMESSAFAL